MYVRKSLHTYTHLPTYLHTYLHTYIPTQLPTYLPTYLHTYIHTYIHTYRNMHERERERARYKHKTHISLALRMYICVYTCRVEVSRVPQRILVKTCRLKAQGLGNRLSCRLAQTYTVSGQSQGAGTFRPHCRGTWMLRVDPICPIRSGIQARVPVWKQGVFAETRLRQSKPDSLSSDRSTLWPNVTFKALSGRSCCFLQPWPASILIHHDACIFRVDGGFCRNEHRNATA